MEKNYDSQSCMDAMKLRLDYNNMMSEFVGSYGIEKQDFDKIEGKLNNAVSAMEVKRQNGLMDWRELPHNQKKVVEDIKEYVAEMKNTIDAFVVLGIGGSALGPMAVQQALNHPYYNELSKNERKGPKFYIADNVDPERLTYLFQIIDVNKCLFNVISKSGSTSETMSQFMIIKEMLEKKLGKEGAKSHIVCTTDAQNGNLIKIAKEEGYKTFIIPSGVGGRFSQLTPVGLLPACFCGIDIDGLLKGAAFMDKQCSNKNISENPAYTYAALNYLAMEKGQHICVMMPYADRLKYISDWYVQLWAESLGKKYDSKGNVVNIGPTPIKALGVTDQHAQVQLFAEGPFDKLVVFIGVDNFHEDIEIPAIYGEIPSLGFLGGETHSKLIKTEQAATEYALLKAGKMNMTITLPEVNAFTLGQLIYMFEVATGFMGELMDINAFDQPGVEEGKNATYAMFGRPGYEEKKKELDAKPAKKSDYII
ncbi:glucose-6-phosphate isomerase [Tyzzerella sp. OttesenSCG-928-J15]|nr:glucose-6-phosphate isomerase [Tyzzerella sp. OttesenSCG-928-J15]